MPSGLTRLKDLPGSCLLYKNKAIKAPTMTKPMVTTNIINHQGHPALILDTEGSVPLPLGRVAVPFGFVTAGGAPYIHFNFALIETLPNEQGTLSAQMHICPRNSDGHIT